ncbi:MAG: hypothetical protein IAE81_14600 [Caldilineaceae bacterium]|nr:hypothetical protein [Caldilineaceae bacterium]
MSALLLLAACRPVTPAPAAHHQPQDAAVIEVAHADDTVTVHTQADATRVDITSPRGIGSARVQFTPAQAAGPIQLRFYLTGLEHALLDNGDVQLEVGISSQPPHLVSQSLTASDDLGDGARLLDENDPLWAAVTLVATEDAPGTIPLRAGPIDVTLPATFLDARHPSLSLRWIDFYR